MTPLQTIIETLQLKPHPEGGYFRETYRSTGQISQEALGNAYSGKRNYSTCIYYLLTSDSFSAFHRIIQDEVWHYYEGSPIALHMISPQGDYLRVMIGRAFDKGQVPQYVIPGGTWFAASVEDSNSCTLSGCTVSPGFDFADFELGKRDELLKRFPQHREVITQLTRAV
ncbi:MAG: cupin domain-containing protein [Bacteroidales bacterium]|nr:cupin domain-containing protein [Bacteroidales bacterium]MBN2761672.1 cupin domain-containing protein [Bacteroidales bacterium]